MNGRLRVAVLYGGRSSEHEVSIASGESVLAALDPKRYEVVPVLIDRSGAWQVEPPRAPELGRAADELPSGGDAQDGPRLALAPGRAGGAMVAAVEEGAVMPASPVGAVDVVLPVLHGPFGEDGTVQGLLEMAGVPYVGAGVAASALTMDKDLCKSRLDTFGIAHADHVVFYADTVQDQNAEGLVAERLGYPCFVKPARLGSSVGISKVHTTEELLPALELAFRHDEKVLVEELVEGREVELGVLGNERPVVSVPGEIKIAAEWYDYDAKYLPGGMELEAPADLEPEVVDELTRTSLIAYRACECAGMARIDYFVTPEGRVVLNEINTIPGFTATSVYARLFEASGIPYAELLDRLIALALERHRQASQYRR